MELEGMIIQDLGEQSGTSNRTGNTWKKHEWLLETFGNFPRKVKFTIFGENRINTIPIEAGKAYAVSIDIESREFNGRWYTDVMAFAARQIEVPAPAQGGNSFGNSAPQGGYTQPSQPTFVTPAPEQQNPFTVQESDFSNGEADDNLPF
ncbi:MAG: DUF3127 domain-containing protein [Muribaculaceae bacterium]|nr:DUF3127 domain-containing protein [Muribaculaceae bacterium]